MFFFATGASKEVPENESISSNTWRPGPGCSKLTTSLVNVSLKFQTLITSIRQYFCRKNVRSFYILSFFQKKKSVC